MQELNRSPVVAKILEGGELKIPMLVNGNYSYEVKNHYGKNYAMIGDARGFVDPIFSSGVFLSMKTAYLVSDAVHYQLTNQLEGENPKLKKSYAELITGAYDFVHRMIRLFYNPHASSRGPEAGRRRCQSHKRHEDGHGGGTLHARGGFLREP